MKRKTDLGRSLALMQEQMRLIGMPPPLAKPSRGRPRKQEPVVTMFRNRLRAGNVDQTWFRERALIQRGWGRANVPSDRTIRRAIGRYYEQLRWENGVVTEESAAQVLRAIAGQK